MKKTNTTNNNTVSSMNVNLNQIKPGDIANKTRKSLEKQTRDATETISKFKKNSKQYIHPNNKPKSKELKLNKKKFK